MTKTSFTKQMRKFSAAWIRDTEEIIVKSLNYDGNKPFIEYGLNKGYINAILNSDNYFEVRWTKKGLCEIGDKLAQTTCAFIGRKVS